MNCTTANKLSIAGFLSSKGFIPTKHDSKSFLYCSPLRNEKTASFKVDRTKNVWYDFGTGCGGGLIDLVCQMYKVNIPGALMILSGSDMKLPTISFEQHHVETKESNLKIKHVQPIQNQILLKYLRSRSIPDTISTLYVDEAYFEIVDHDTGDVKKYFSLAFKNDLGGYELRNKFWKGCCSPKAITTFSGHCNRINVFEGFIDFLSALVFFKQPEPQNTVIVLNSLSHLKYLDSILPGFNQINLFLDNDQAGKKATLELQSKFGGVMNQSERLFPRHKDFNEFINNK